MSCCPTWVAFAFNNGLNFGLWSIKAKDFVSNGNGNCSELSFMINDKHCVHELYNKWKNLGVTIEQDLHEAVFGLTFVVLDPDGHRI
jgi:uncharacterized glyoxalase superfamily protein PhnB